MAIHCRQGIGRSAMLAASLLVIAGVPPTEAWSRIRETKVAVIHSSRDLASAAEDPERFRLEAIEVS